MKKYFLSFLLIFTAYTVFAQVSTDCVPEDFEDVDDDDQVRAANDCVLELSNGILGMTMGEVVDLEDDDITAYFEAGNFILDWCIKSPDYSFGITEKCLKMLQAHSYMKPVFFACLAKAALDGEKDFMEEGVDMFYKYVTNPKNGVPQEKKMKKFIKDYQKGKKSAYYVG